EYLNLSKWRLKVVAILVMIECLLFQDIQRIEIMTRRKHGRKKQIKQKKRKSRKKNIAHVDEQHVEELSDQNGSDDLSAHGNEPDPMSAHENETDHLSATSQVFFPKLFVGCN